MQPLACRRVWASVPVVLLALSACRSPTEVTLVLTTDTCAAGYGATSITVVTVPGPGADAGPSTVTTHCSLDGSIGSLVVVPGASVDQPFLVTVMTEVEAGVSPPSDCFHDPKHCIVATREMGFIEHTPLVLPIEMQRGCEGVACDGSTTCVESRCVPWTITPRMCLGATGCNLDQLDAGAGGGMRDATVTDATVHHDARMPAPDAPPATGDAGACDAGPGVTPLACGRDDPFGITVDENDVYWTEKGGVMKVPKVGGTVTTLASNQLTACGVAVDLDSVYWTNTSPGEILSAPLTGGSPELLATPAKTPASIRRFGSLVYWVEPDAGVYARGIDSTSPVVTLATYRATDLQIDDGGLFVLGPGYVGLVAGGDLPPQLVMEANGGQALALDSTSLYWTAGAEAGLVFAMPRTGTAVLTLAGTAAGVGSPRGIAADGVSVYWADSSKGVIGKVVLETGSVTTFATGQVGAFGVAVDFVNVYWTTRTSPGAILKKAKGPAPGQAEQ